MLATDEYKKAELEYTLAEAQRGFRIHAVGTIERYATRSRAAA